MPQNAVDQVQAGNYQGGSTAVDEYALEPGVCVLPLAEDPPGPEEYNEDGTPKLATWSPVVPLRLHAPYRIRTARGQANKTGAPPVVPSPADSGKFVFVGGGVRIENSLNSTLCTFDWDVRTEFTFVENCVSRNEDGFVLTGAPWTFRSTEVNQTLYSNTPPQFGAISAANPDAITGYNQGIVAQSGNRNTGIWEYNTSTYYPGWLLSDELVNGGITGNNLLHVG